MALIRTTPANKVDRKVEPVYADLPKNLRRHPLTDDIAPLFNEEAINEALRNVVLMGKGESLYRPNKGGNIKAMLFQNLTPMLIEVLRDQIQSTIRAYEPRVNIVEVLVGNQGDHTLSVRITYEIPSREKPLQTTVFIERKR